MALDDRLVFIIGAPRSGTTLLARLMHATPGVWAPPEPHLIPGLIHSGLLRRVERAQYDPIRGQRALQRFAASLPRGEAELVDGLRELAERLYRASLESAPSGTTHVVDKTPANALALEPLTRLFPRARYLLITRHPLAVLHSYSASFFDGDVEAAHRFNPVLARYLPQLAWLARQDHLAVHRLSFEDLVEAPEEQLAAVCAFLGLPFDPGALDYHRAAWPADAEGDPTGVGRYRHPEPSRAWGWVTAVAGDDACQRVAARQRALVSEAELRTLGWSRGALFEPLVGAGAPPTARRRWDRHSAERRLLRLGRRLLASSSLYPWRARARDAIEVLTRPGFGPHE